MKLFRHLRESTPVKLCVNCRHFLPYQSEDKEARITLSKCAASAKILSLVDGQAHDNPRFCDNERMPHADCGPEARKFEPNQDDINV